jgi:hypothetical protein
VDSSDLYSTTLITLSNLRNFMMSEEWIEAVNQAPLNVKKQAFSASFQVQHAINVLSNQILSDIADEMAEQDAAIIAATQSLSDSLENFKKVSTVLASIGKLLGVIAQIVSLV